MSLLDKINENTEKVRTGKSNLVAAITSKGGSVSAAGSVPTFNELINGVNSIDTSSGGGSGGEPIIETITVYSAGNGAVDISGVAQSNIFKGDTVKALKNTAGAITLVGTSDLPTQGKVQVDETNWTTYALVNQHSVQSMTDSKLAYYHSRNKNFIYCSANGVRQGNTYINPCFAFWKVGGEYKQLKVNDKYQLFPSDYLDSTTVGKCNTASVGRGIAFDEDSQILYVKDLNNNKITAYQLDIENLNLIPLAALSGIGGIDSNSSIYSCKDNIFISSKASVYGLRRVKFDRETNTFSDVVTIYKGSSGLTTIGDIYYNRSRNILYIIYENFLYRFTLNSDGIFVHSKYIWKAGISSFRFAGNILLTNSNATTWYKLIDLVEYDGTFSLTQVSDVSSLFWDSTNVIDYTALSKVFVDHSGYMFAGYSSGGTCVLFEWQEDENGDGKYKLIGQTTTNFLPTLSGSDITPIDTWWDADFNYGYDIYNSAEDKMYRYKKVIEGGAYKIAYAGNQLSNENNLYGFGVAFEDIPAGEEGTVSIGVRK